MSDGPPQRPPRPKHVPFWPVLVGVAFMIAVVVSGVVASNSARKDNVDAVPVSTSTLPPRNATTSTSTVVSSTTVISSAAPTAACTSANLIKAVEGSGHVDASLIGHISMPKFKCVSGYALARLVPVGVDGQTADADFKLQSDGTWASLSIGTISPTQDSIPKDVAAQLILE